MQHFNKIHLIGKYVVSVSNYLKMSSSSSSSPPPKKRNKPNNPSTSKASIEVDSAKRIESFNFKEQFQSARLSTAESVLEFKFNKNRVRILSSIETVSDDANGIVYWMSRDCRVQDNWAFLYVRKIWRILMFPCEFI